MMTPTTAMRQASMTAEEYARDTLNTLAGMLQIDRKAPDWREQLAPFANVWAAMIAASSSDYEVAANNGAITGVGPLHGPATGVCPRAEEMGRAQRLEGRTSPIRLLGADIGRGIPVSPEPPVSSSWALEGCPGPTKGVATLLLK